MLLDTSEMARSEALDAVVHCLHEAGAKLHGHGLAGSRYGVSDGDAGWIF